jgi:hypothetical protein
MKTLKTLSTALIASLAVVALSATAAMAHTWEFQGKPIKGVGDKFVLGETLEFENRAEGGTYVCTVVEEGLVGPGAVGKVTAFTNTEGGNAISCTTRAGGHCGGPLTIEAQKLPWSTELVTLNGALRNSAVSTQELKFKCTEFGGSGTYINYCTLPSSTKVTNVSSGVQLLYNEEKYRGTCSNNSQGTLVVGGGGILKGPSGEESFRAS